MTGRGCFLRCDHDQCCPLWQNAARNCQHCAVIHENLNHCPGGTSVPDHQKVNIWQAGFVGGLNGAVDGVLVTW